MESPIYTVPELTRIVRVVRDHVPPIQVKFSFIHECIAEMSPFNISTRPVSCVRDFLHVRSKYRRRTLALK